jgi:hypothetical protein
VPETSDRAQQLDPAGVASLPPPAMTLPSLLPPSGGARPIDRGYVVVLFGGTTDGWCTLPHCPVGTVEWFPTREAAAAYCDTVPAGFQPHILSVSGDPRPGGAVAP